MLRIRESRAFTMIELIVVIVILGILAAIAAVSYNAVITRSKKSAIEQVAQQVGNEFAAAAAFDNAAPTFAAYGATVANDVPSGSNIYAGATTGNVVVATPNGDTCLTLGTSVGASGKVLTNLDAVGAPTNTLAGC